MFEPRLIGRSVGSISESAYFVASIDTRLVLMLMLLGLLDLVVVLLLSTITFIERNVKIFIFLATCPTWIGQRIWLKRLPISLDINSFYPLFLLVLLLDMIQMIYVLHN